MMFEPFETRKISGHETVGLSVSQSDKTRDFIG
jgi:hypothetical protein